MPRIRLLALAAILAACPDAFAQVATMPPQTGTFNGSTRGYWFTAPSSFTITGVMVDAQTGSTATLQNFAVVHFDGNIPPPTFSATTNAFTQLAFAFDQPANTFIPVNVADAAGDVIGIYGNMVTAVGATTGQNSYGSGTVGTTINGVPVTLTRSGMQFHLGMATSPAGMHDIWQEPTSVNITRVDFSYSAVPEPSSMLLLAGVGFFSTVTARGRRMINAVWRRD